jgi:hypothetical protein
MDIPRGVWFPWWNMKRSATLCLCAHAAFAAGCANPPGRNFGTVEPDAAVRSNAPVVASSLPPTSSSSTALATSSATPSSSTGQPAASGPDVDVSDAASPGSSSAVRADASESSPTDSTPADAAASTSIPVPEASPSASTSTPPDTTVSERDAAPEAAPDPGPPPGYYSTSSQHGCSWVDADDVAATTISPTDFTGSDEQFCVSGQVGPDENYFGYVELGFNVNQDADTSCASADRDPTAPDVHTADVTGNGIGVTFAKRGADQTFTLRLLLKGPNGHLNDDVGADDRWCYTIPTVSGSFFVPWTAFTKECWFTDSTAYAGEPLSSISFIVPGAYEDPVPFDFCVSAMGYGDSVSDALGN